MVDFTQIFFILSALLILFSIFMTWTVPKTMQAAYWLILMLVGVSVLFILANSEILFAFQVSIYAGGISVLLLFAALLTQHDEYLFEGDSFFGVIQNIGTQIFAFILLSGNLVFLAVFSVLNADYLNNPESSGGKVLGDTSRTVDEAFEQTSQFTIVLWTEYAVVIPFVAMLFLVALLGSVKLVIREWELEDISKSMMDRYQQIREVRT